MSMFNEDQQDYMRSLAKLEPEELCPCGWYPEKQCAERCPTDNRESISYLHWRIRDLQKRLARTTNKD